MVTSCHEWSNRDQKTEQLFLIGLTKWLWNSFFIGFQAHPGESFCELLAKVKRVWSKDKSIRNIIPALWVCSKLLKPWKNGLPDPFRWKEKFSMLFQDYSVQSCTPCLKHHHIIDCPMIIQWWCCKQRLDKLCCDVSPTCWEHHVWTRWNMCASTRWRNGENWSRVSFRMVLHGLNTCRKIGDIFLINVGVAKLSEWSRSCR